MLKKIAAACILFGALAGCSSRQADTAVSAPTPVKVARARQFEAPALVAVSGSVVSPDNPSNVAFLVSGKVIQVGPREGDYVRKGQVLAVIDPTDYAFGVEAAAGQTQAARAVLEKAESPARPEVLEQARIAFERARDEFQRMKQLYESKSLPPNDFEKFRAVYEGARQQYEQARSGGQKEDREQARAVYEQAVAGEKVARKRLADATLVSPIEGYVAGRAVEVGDMAAAGRPVFEIVRLDPVEVSVGVPETDIHLVRAGQKATIRIPALPGETFTGSVRVINVAADPSTRSYMARIAVPNPRHILRLGMVAEARIESDRRATVMTVPGDAIVRDAQGATTVFVYFPDQGRVYARRVETATVYGNEVQIRNGLRPAELVVVAGQHKLREGSAASVVEAPPAARESEAKEER
ncbi:MAG: efflux RND transporter periplasmic adaptor subunit [Bryobacterales bacterium]|nr:efflux RND transporter periplasmic adaptor subunit [Bryobacterales bacterium]